MMRLELLFLILIQLSACGLIWIPPKPVEYIRGEDGGLKLDCDGRTIPYRAGGAEDFWKKNNLPKGTTDFVCKDGKAYLLD